jgi:peptide/nickel transport system substrate-binding protein
VADAAIAKVVNPSDHKGGTLKFAMSDVLDSSDPGDTYYAMVQNFARLYGRTMMGFKPAPGEAGLELVPDLAAGPGVPSNGNKTWTYKIKPGIKYEDGTEVKAADVKYAIARSNFAKDVLPNGPDYFAQLTGSKYKGPYKDKNLDSLKEITTPDDHTLVINLVKPFTDMDYLMTFSQTMPVPASKDTGATGGANYKKHVFSTGPYMFEGTENVDKQINLVRNPNWDQSTDPIRKGLPDRVELALQVDANEIDSRLQQGTLQVDLAGTGVQAAARSKILSSPTLKKNSDDAYSGFLWYTAINSKVAPFDKVECRRAMQYAADSVALQAAYGGPVAGGDIASTILPPNIAGYQKSDIYPNGADNTGDVTKAKEQLAACGQPNGFKMNLAYRSDRPKEKAAGEAWQQALAKIGVQATLKGYPAGKYYTNFAGVPNFVHKNNIGMMTGGWAADWPTGYGFLQQILDGRSIKPAGNSNLSETDDKQIESWLDEAMTKTEPADRAALYTKIDQKQMELASIVPTVYAKSLLFRPDNLTNVYVTDAYGMYDYTQLGVK